MYCFICKCSKHILYISWCYNINSGNASFLKYKIAKKKVCTIISYRPTIEYMIMLRHINTLNINVALYMYFRDIILQQKQMFHYLFYTNKSMSIFVNWLIKMLYMKINENLLCILWNNIILRWYKYHLKYKCFLIQIILQYFLVFFKSCLKTIKHVMQMFEWNIINICV